MSHNFSAYPFHIRIQNNIGEAQLKKWILQEYNGMKMVAYRFIPSVPYLNHSEIDFLAAIQEVKRVPLMGLDV